ncbi:NAD(P)/FAD-dependent oxidoreductase [Ideonella sp. B508-1]|uniref:flavin-containing monooxygenase n=1 Tax=Ideonella sp. B508-1 TaxID=137716 RepID=UPI00034CE600|nr:NAD(P)/FAD-dependent oxidoreductase [Ideonella sp. B508-1]
MDICIVGAGFAGLSAAKVLKTFGHRVTVYEKVQDVGGVWSRTRRYPGLTTQNVRSTYALSDFPYPKNYPEWPSGEQVQRYMHAYAEHFGLLPLIRLGTEVVAARPAGRGWEVDVRAANDPTAAVQTRRFDWLLVCNGIFSQPAVPRYEGAEAFRAAGGVICHTSEFNEAEVARDRHVLVVGYGKSSCDAAQAIVGTAASTTVVARQLIWKVPKMLMGVLNYKHLLLTRMGEGLFRYIRLRGVEKFLHGLGRPVRNAMLGQVQWVITRQCKLRKLDLLPAQPFESIARSTVSLVTDGFYENVAAGRLRVEKNTEIQRLVVENGVRWAELSNGQRLRADVIVCGTGWHQRVPFLPAEVMQRVTDEQGNFMLYRSMVPIGVPRLAFNGYNSSFFSQLNAEIGALWLADLIGGQLTLPSVAQQRATVAERLAWMEARTDGKHSKGTNIIPFSLHHIDELLGDIGLQLSPFKRFTQWLRPVDPADYAWMTPALLSRHRRKASAPTLARATDG